MTRRAILARAASATLATVNMGCAARPKRNSSILQRPVQTLFPVNCSRERVIRTIAGLRPFRPSGFVVRSEKIDNKLIIHNYGHGGAGITLSWGTAQLALEEGESSGFTEFAVLGSGVIGLSTARLFQRRGFAVTIYTKDTPPNTTSNIAGGWWAPVTLFEPGRQTPAFTSQYVRAAMFAHRYYQNFVNDYYGVRWLPMYLLSKGGSGEPTSVDPPEIDRLYINSTILQKDENPFPENRVKRFWSMLIEPPIYLNALVRDYQLAGGKIVIREFPDLRSVLAVKEPAVVNCTGLGAKALFGDSELMPVKGQLSFLIPQPEVQYCTAGPGEDLYMFPRRDGILLGGTHEKGLWSVEPDPTHAARIVDQHAELFRRMRVG